MLTEAENAAADRIDRTPRSNMVTICQWCPELHILKFDRRHDDIVMISQVNKQITISRNGAVMQISCGICEPCAANLRANQAVRVAEFPGSLTDHETRTTDHV